MPIHAQEVFYELFVFLAESERMFALHLVCVPPSSTHSLQLLVHNCHVSQPLHWRPLHSSAMAASKFVPVRDS